MTKREPTVRVDLRMPRRMVARVDAEVSTGVFRSRTELICIAVAELLERRMHARGEVYVVAPSPEAPPSRRKRR